MKMNKGRVKILGNVALFVCLLCPVITQAAPNYIASEIPMGQDTGRPFFADMNGDGALDVLVGHWSALEGRELFIYLQESNGSFSAEPSRRVEIKPEIIAVTTAELGENPGNELIFLTSDGVYSFSSAIDSYSGNVKKLIDWPLIASTPHRKELIYLGELPDINQDGNVDLLLPYSEGVGVFYGKNNLFSLSAEIKTIGDDYTSLNREGFANTAESTGRLLDDEGNIVIDVPTQTSSQFGFFLSKWDAENNRSGSNLLNANNWVPAAILASINNAKRSDLVFLLEEEEKLDQLNLLTQLEDGSFKKDVNWQNSVNAEGRLRLVDFSGDGLDDIIRIVGRNDEWDLYFYKNIEGAFSFDKPNQVMKFSGFDLRVEFNDLTGDAKPELIISFYTIPVMDVIRDVRVQRTRLLYRNNGANFDSSLEKSDQGEQVVFNRRPDYKLEEKFAASSILAINALANLNHDIDNDQQNDYLYVAADGTLQARTIDSESLQINAEEFWQYVPDHSILSLRVKELNDDSKPDLILYHSLHFTVLISTQ